MVLLLLRLLVIWTEWITLCCCELLCLFSTVGVLPAFSLSNGLGFQHVDLVSETRTTTRAHGSIVAP